MSRLAATPVACRRDFSPRAVLLLRVCRVPHPRSPLSRAHYPPAWEVSSRGPKSQTFSIPPRRSYPESFTHQG
jgi:hypothetical protein